MRIIINKVKEAATPEEFYNLKRGCIYSFTPKLQDFIDSNPDGNEIYNFVVNNYLPDFINYIIYIYTEHRAWARYKLDRNISIYVKFINGASYASLAREHGISATYIKSITDKLNRMFNRYLYNEHLPFYIEM